MLDNKTKERIAQEAIDSAVSKQYTTPDFQVGYIAGAEAEATRAVGLILLLETLLADRNLSIPGGMMPNESVKQIREALANYNNPVNK